MAERGPFTPSYVLDHLDPGEMVEGFRSAYAGEPEPGDNRSDAFWWGWTSGHNDKLAASDDGGIEPDAHIAVAREMRRRRELANPPQENP